MRMPEKAVAEQSAARCHSSLFKHVLLSTVAVVAVCASARADISKDDVIATAKTKPFDSSTLTWLHNNLDEAQYPESDYKLTPAAAKSDTTVTLFDKNNTPHYYNFSPIKTDFSPTLADYGAGDMTKTVSFTGGVLDGLSITARYNSTPTSARLTEFTTEGEDISGNWINNTATESGAAVVYGNDFADKDISSITGDFVGNSVAFDSASRDYRYGGALALMGARYQEINSINGNFIDNHTTMTGNEVTIFGGAVFNRSKLHNITGTFIGNSAETTGESAKSYGGAFSNSYPIYDISGTFIGNYAISTNESYGGAFYNSNTIKNALNGTFIGNHTDAVNISQGGAFYNSYSVNGWIISDFIGNYASSTGDSSKSWGGAVYNVGYMSNGFIGDFIGNYVTTSGENATAYGGGFYNTTPMYGGLTGDFSGNYALSTGDNAQAYGGAIAGVSNIGPVTGNFFNNHTIATKESFGGAIFIQGTSLDKVTGDFIGNYAEATGEGSNSSGGALFNRGGSISGITGNFIDNHISATKQS